jgi:ElaB/YqjD/DUF883 family membrane-anchored ribosome-binding protein
MDTENEIGQAAGDLKSSATGVVKEYHDKAEQVWNDTREHVQTFKGTADRYVRENPTKAVFTAFGIGFVLGFVIFRR